MIELLAIYVSGATLWGAFGGAALCSALGMWERWGDAEDRELVKRRARIVLAAPVWPLALIVAAAIGVRNLIRYAQGKVPE